MKKVFENTTFGYGAGYYRENLYLKNEEDASKVSAKLLHCGVWVDLYEVEIPDDIECCYVEECVDMYDKSSSIYKEISNGDISDVSSISSYTELMEKYPYVFKLGGI